MAKISKLTLPVTNESTGQVTSQIFDIGGKEYTAGYGINIDANDEIESTTFVGTQAEWDALTPAEQAAFDIINITDDYTPSTEIQISYVDTLPVAGIKDVVYGLRSFGTPATATAADGFLDSVDAFTKTTLLPSGYEYTSGTAEISLDGVTYNNFSSIVYDGTKFIIDGETELALGDTLYYRVLSGITYYGGDANAQTTTPIGKDPVDVVADGNMNAVTSNAVYNEVADVLRADTMEEIGGTASKAYSVGEYFIGTDGLMYKVTAAIASGGTITLNTNCVKTDIADELCQFAYDSELITLGDTRIPSGSDLNDYTTPGVYSVWAGADVIDNQPISGRAGKLIVLRTLSKDRTDFITQIYFDHGSRATHIRYTYDGGTTWVSWGRLLTNLDEVYTHNLNVDLLQANNGVSSDMYSNGLYHRDKNGYSYAGLRGIAMPNGSTRGEFLVTNRDSNGNLIEKVLKMQLDKSQNLTYIIPDPHKLLPALGIGYGTCDTAEATAVKTATLANYVLVLNGYVTIKFTNSVPASATLNINSKGAKPIYYRGAAISDGVINAGDRATFIYNGSQYDLIAIDHAVVERNHNVPRSKAKDITAYVTDGSLWKRLNGTDGYALFEDIFVGDYIHMSKAITAPGSSVTGSEYVTIAGINSLYGNGDGNATVPDVDYNHLVMIPGMGIGGTPHFGRARMNSTNTTAGAYKASEMNTNIIGSVVSSGSTASGATINQQLYAEFGTHLKTTRELFTNATSNTIYNRFGTQGASSGWEWISAQAILMSEVEVYGSIVWSSSGYDTGVSNYRLPYFNREKSALNNHVVSYWLKDVASSTQFCSMSYRGVAIYTVASDASTTYVRPRFVLA